jgi:phage-related protein
MPRTRVRFFQETDERVPLLEWMDRQESRLQAKCVVGIERLQECGHELRRPEAEYLRDGIYELRISYRRNQYGILYCFSGRMAAVLSHAFLKKGSKVPLKEIQAAVRRKNLFEADPDRHTYQGDQNDD